MHGLPCRGLATSFRGCNMKNCPRKPRSSWSKKLYKHMCMPCNFCFIKFCVKCMVWPGLAFRPQKASQRPDVFKHTRKPFSGHDLQLFQISLKIGPTVWISLADIHTNTHIELYILDNKWDVYSPGACIIKLITAVIYGFCNKLECLSLASLSSLV